LVWFDLKLFPKRFDRNLDGEREARTGAWASREEVSSLVMVVLMVITRGVVRVVGAVVVLVVVLLLWLRNQTHRGKLALCVERGQTRDRGRTRGCFS
jgi:predicted LPLAT superfamily acyltransferase